MKLPRSPILLLFALAVGCSPADKDRPLRPNGTAVLIAAPMPSETLAPADPPVPRHPTTQAIDAAIDELLHPTKEPNMPTSVGQAPVDIPLFQLHSISSQGR